MKIYFTCSTAEFNKYQDLYFAIRNFLIAENHTLTRDWLPHTQARLKTGHKEIRDIKQIYKSCIKAIKEADIVIIEDTVSNFSTGHQITKALQMKKPTLVLWQGQKYRQFNQMFIHGIDSEILDVVEYNTADIEKVITIFLNKYKNISEKNRFHLVLNNLERSYLDWAQHKYKKSRTKIIKDSLREVIDKDNKFQKYLGK
ncbi:hypothetical protein JW887_00050 [Candidatus Dojkabacteria bacterium]|nr:hypothetical protein [Candidatus Dojkabacteria bacterium]